MRRWPPVVLFTIGTVIALLAAVATAAVVNAADSGPKHPKPEVSLKFDAKDDESGQDDLIGGDVTGKPVPATTFALLAGGTTKLTAFHGKPLVVNFWATTCAPCIKEMPALETVHQEMGADVQFVGLDVRDSPSGGQEFVQRTGVTYTIGRDPSGGIFESFDAVNLPTTFFVNADGMIVDSHTGALTADQLREKIAAIK